LTAKNNNEEIQAINDLDNMVSGDGGCYWRTIVAQQHEVKKRLSVYCVHSTLAWPLDDT